MTEQVDRRTFARRAVAAIGAAIGAVFGIPAAATLLDPALRSRQARWTVAQIRPDGAEQRHSRPPGEVDGLAA